jgi:anti-anti-sigma factor
MTWPCSVSCPRPFRPVKIEVLAGPLATTVIIDGELDLVTKAFLAERLTLILRENPRRLVLDVERTSFMDCGCAQVIGNAARSMPADGCLVIRRLSPGIRRVLELTGVDAYCEIEP